MSDLGMGPEMNKDWFIGARRSGGFLSSLFPTHWDTEEGQHGSTWFSEDAGLFGAVVERKSRLLKGNGLWLEGDYWANVVLFLKLHWSNTNRQCKIQDFVAQHLHKIALTLKPPSWHSIIDSIKITEAVTVDINDFRHADVYDWGFFWGGEGGGHLKSNILFAADSWQLHIWHFSCCLWTWVTAPETKHTDTDLQCLWHTVSRALLTMNESGVILAFKVRHVNRIYLILVKHTDSHWLLPRERCQGDIDEASLRSYF